MLRTGWDWADEFQERVARRLQAYDNSMAAFTVTNATPARFTIDPALVASTVPPPEPVPVAEPERETDDGDSEFRGALYAAIGHATGKVPKRYVPEPAPPPPPPPWGFVRGDSINGVQAGALVLDGRVFRANTEGISVVGGITWRGLRVPGEFLIRREGARAVFWSMTLNFTGLLGNGTRLPIAERPVFTFGGTASDFIDWDERYPDEHPSDEVKRARVLTVLRGCLTQFEHDMEDARGELRNRLRDFGITLSSMAQQVAEAFGRLRSAIADFGTSMRAAWVAARDFNQQVEALSELRGEPFAGITFQRSGSDRGLQAEPITELLAEERTIPRAFELAEELQAVEYAVRDTFSGRQLTPALAEEVATVTAELLEETFRRMAGGRNITLPRLNVAQSPARRLHFYFSTPSGNGLPFIGPLVRFLTL